jgi:hypothetical protein
LRSFEKRRPRLIFSICQNTEFESSPLFNPGAFISKLVDEKAAALIPPLRLQIFVMQMAVGARIRFGVDFCKTVMFEWGR